MRSKTILAFLSTFLLATSFISMGTLAMSAAMVVKDSTALSETHEQRVYTVLEDMGFDITLVDGVADYSSFDLIVVAGRPRGQMLGDFASSIPVNDVPTVAIDTNYIDDWGWADAPGISSFVSSNRQAAYITDEHALTWGFFMDEKVYVHRNPGYTETDLVDEYTNLKAVASPTTSDKYGLIRYGTPGMQLNDGRSISSDSAVVFFGITYPVEWTNEAEQLFRNAVQWLTSDTDGDGAIDYMDNCVRSANAAQTDVDGDGVGDVCDAVDNRPDLIVQSITFPSSRIECDDMDVRVDVENVGNYAADQYKVYLTISGSSYEADGSSLDANDAGQFVFSVDGSNLCGYSERTVVAGVGNSVPSETDVSNNQLSASLVFTVLKTDVDGDGKKEKATDGNGNTADGYEIYSDADSSSSSTTVDGDMDGKVDYLIDIGKDGILDRYWDPDNRVLSNLTRDADTSIFLIDVNGDGQADAEYNSTSGVMDYMDDASPSVVNIEVTPTFGGSTWYMFNVSAAVSDAGTGINTHSCEYTTDGSTWLSADYANGKCYKESVSAAMGSSLHINVRVRDAVGNIGIGVHVARTVSARPLNVQTSADKPSYSPSATALMSGYVSYADSGVKVAGATVNYYFGSVSGSRTTDASGHYEFNITLPNPYGTYPLNVSASHIYSSGSSLVSLSVPQPTSDSPSQGAPPAGKMTAYMPDQLTAYAGSDEQFIVTVTNTGYTTLSFAKVSLQADMPFDISPDVTSVASGGSQDFVVTLHVPEGASGTHIIDVSALSFGVKIEKEVALTIMPTNRPHLEISAMDAPVVFAGEVAELNLSISNTGDADALAIVEMAAPDGWNPATYSISVAIPALSDRIVSFPVTPSGVLGTVEFTVSYLSGSESVVASDSVEVEPVEREVMQMSSGTQPVTAMVASVVSSPWFYVPASIATASALLFMARRSISRGAYAEGKNYSSGIKPMRTVSVYQKWESKQRKQW